MLSVLDLRRAYPGPIHGEFAGGKRKHGMPCFLRPILDNDQIPSDTRHHVCCVWDYLVHTMCATTLHMPLHTSHFTLRTLHKAVICGASPPILDQHALAVSSSTPLINTRRFDLLTTNPKNAGPRIGTCGHHDRIALPHTCGLGLGWSPPLCGFICYLPPPST